jgi:outer membrane protein, heavy metal efflux system
VYLCIPALRRNVRGPGAVSPLEEWMKPFVSAFCVLLAGIPAGSATAQSPGTSDGLTKIAILLQHQPQPEAAGPALTLAEAERIALAANPEIEVAARRVFVAKAHVPTVGGLDDPSAMYRGWGVPLKKPWDFNQTQNMFSVSENLPGTGKRDLRTSIAESDVDEAKANLDQVRLEVEVNVRKAFDEVLLAQDELKFHEQHEAIAQQAIEATRVKYASGSVPQQDILKAQVALTGLAEHMIRFDRDAALADARLNVLMGRDPAEPITVSGDHAVLVSLPSLQALEDAALGARPDLVAAQQAAERSHKEQTLAKRVYAPDFTVSAGYMLMPSGTDMRNAYMVEGSMNLPWLNRRKHDAEIAEATAKATEQDAELTSMRNAARGQIQEALVETQAAQQLAHMYHDQLMPQAEATLQASVIAYANDKTAFLDLLDSQMTVIDVDLNWIQAVGEFDAHLSDLQMAAGVPFDKLQQTTPEVKP